FALTALTAEGAFAPGARVSAVITGTPDAPPPQDASVSR
ncbi:1-aminocyclopropane-1-carboxylate deaminase, partial [Streptomyces sp. SID7499]|nr:1-aminocyclopropane-1-carboxylate deaminase [Streptomyces sp. SID7499]